MFRESGGRASIAWVICPPGGDNLLKRRLIPNVTGDGIVSLSKAGIRKDRSLRDGPACHQLVGGVTAHQGYDG